MDVRLRNSISVTRTEYGAVLLDENSGEYWQLNPTGAEIAEGLLAGRGLDGVAADLARDYDVPPERARADAEALAAELRAAGLVRA